MSTTDCGLELELVHGRRTPQGPMAAMLVRTKAVWRALKNRLASNRLHELDDRELCDIGLTRHDVAAALDHSGVLADPSRLLERAAQINARTRFTRQPQ